jgi:hypothetical protein
MFNHSPSPAKPCTSTPAPVIDAHRFFLHELFARTRSYLEHRPDINKRTRRRSSCGGGLSSQRA